MMKTILLMTDFSENARNAINYGISMFGEEVNYLLMHSYHYKRNAGYFKDLSDRLRHESVDGLANELKLINAKFPQFSSLEVKLLNEANSPIDAVQSIQERYPVDLIVMGTKGATGIGTELFGSVASSIIFKTRLPVLAIPDEAVYEPIKSIIFATDLQSNETDNVMDPLMFIAKRYQAKVNFVHMIEPKESSSRHEKEIEEKYNDLYDTESIDAELKIVLSTDFGASINKFHKHKEATILAVITRNKSFFERLFHKSFTKELALNSKRPLLALDDLI